MTDFPQQQAIPVTVTTIGRFGLGGGISRFGAGGSSQLQPSTLIGQNIATYTPIWLPFRYPIQNFFVVNGTTVNGNIDVGIYNQDGARIWSNGPVTQTPTSSLQFFAKDLVLDPGCYYLAVASSSGTSTVNGMQIATATRLRYWGLLGQGSLSSGTLPSPATFATFSNTSHIIPAMGFTYQSGTPNF